MVIYQHKKCPENIILNSIDGDEILEWITKKYASYNKAFIEFGKLSLNALKMFINENINSAFNDNKLLKLCNAVLTDVLKTYYNCKRSSGKLLNIGYYIECGHSEAKAHEFVAQIQRRRCPRCIEYWLDKGCSYEAACEEVSRVQKRNANKSVERLSIEYWLASGLSYDEAVKKQDEYKTKIASSSKRHLKQINHLSDDEISQIVQKRYNTRDPKLHASRHNTSLEEAETVIKDRIARSTCVGKRNGMYNHPSPLRTGAAYSGYYKNFYFRSFSEYCFIKLHEHEAIQSAEMCCAVKWNNDNKTYRPDFIIGDTIYEIKADYMIEDKETVDKIEALQKAFPQFKIELIPAKSIPKPPKDVVLSDIKNGYLRIDNTKSDRFRQFMERYK